MMCIDLKLYLSRYGFKITLSAFISSIPASISFSFNHNVDRQSSNYMRFVTHIKFFMERYFTNSMLSCKDDLLYNQIKCPSTGNGNSRKNQIIFRAKV